MIRAGPDRGPTHSSRAANAAARVVELVPVTLVVVAEAAWISIVAGLLQGFAHREQALGIPVGAAFVAAGIVAARSFGRPHGRRWPAIALILVVTAGIVGWLASPSARGALGDGLGPAIAANPGGWTAGLAVLRGFAHARLPLAEATVARMLGLGVPGIAISAIVGGLIGEPFRAGFLADALGASIVFIVAAMLALALTRLNAIGGDAGIDWRRNPLWLVLTVALLLVAIVAAVPLSAVAGTAIETFFAVAIGPLLVLGLLTGLDRRLRRVLGVILVGGLILLVLIRVFGGNPGSSTPAAAGVAAGHGTSPIVDQVMTITFGGALLVVAVLVVVVLAAVWMERVRPPDDDIVGESRTIDRGDGEPVPHRRRWRLGRQTRPTGAPGAYVALIRDLESHPDVRRGAAETPAEHAARLRSDGRGALSLDLLAADYALDRYGGVSLPEREHRRAVGRWRLLRRRLTGDLGGSRPSR